MDANQTFSHSAQGITQQLTPQQLARLLVSTLRAQQELIATLSNPSTFQTSATAPLPTTPEVQKALKQAIGELTHIDSMIVFVSKHWQEPTFSSASVAKLYHDLTEALKQEKNARAAELSSLKLPLSQAPFFPELLRRARALDSKLTAIDKKKIALDEELSPSG